MDRQTEPSLAGLANGGAMLVFTDYSAESGGDIMARMFKKNGDPVFVDFAISADEDETDFEPDVAALSDGGFAVSWTRDFEDSGDYDTRVRMFNADGSPSTIDQGVDASQLRLTRHPSVAGLAGGGFVVVYEMTPEGQSDTDVLFRIYDATGQDIADGEVDAAFDPQTDPQVLALQDGGFAVALTSSDVNNETGLDISFRIFDAGGAPRTNLLPRINANTDGDQLNPTLAQLSNGHIVVGWWDALELNYQLFDPAGTAIGGNDGVTAFTVESELAALSGGRVVNVSSSIISDGSGGSVQLSIDQLVRTTAGEATNETLNGDDLADHILGGGGKDKLSGFNGKDTLEGGAGDDVLRGGAGRDQLIGGTGADKLVFTEVLQSRPSPGADLVKGFENGVDKLDVSAIDARVGTAGDQAFVFGTGAFTGEGQIRAVQSGADTIVRFNASGADTPEMEILLKNFDADEISGADFVL